MTIMPNMQCATGRSTPPGSGLKNFNNALFYCFSLCAFLAGGSISCFLPRANPFDPLNPQASTSFPASLHYRYNPAEKSIDLEMTLDTRDLSGIIWALDCDGDKISDLHYTTADKNLTWNIVPDWNRTLYVSATAIATDGTRGEANLRIEKPWTYFGPSELGVFAEETDAPDLMISAVAMDSSHHVWAGTRGGWIYELWANGDSVRIHDVNRSSAPVIVRTPIRSILAGRDGRDIWIGRRPSYAGTTSNGPRYAIGGGLLQYDGSRWSLFNYGHGLPDTVINCLAQTSDGNVWLGTSSLGLVSFNGQTFDLEPGLLDPTQKLLNVNAIAIDREQNVWIGCWDSEGLARLDAKTNTFEVFLNEAIDPTFENPAWTELADNNITALTSDPDGNVWIGTREGLVRFDQQSTLKRYTTSNSKLPRNEIRALAIDHSGNVWIGTSGFGLAQYNAHSDTWEIYNNDADLPDKWVNSIVSDGQHSVWIGTNNGLIRHYKLDP